MTEILQSRSEFWQKRWNNMAKQSGHFATMGRSNYSISDYFAYISDLVKGLGNVSPEDTLLDAAGGCGYLSLYFSPLVKEIDLFDYSTEAIKRAKEECKNFNNINAYEDNLLSLNVTKSKNKQYDKILVGGALQYFDSYDELSLILKNIYDVTKRQGRVFVSQTTDLSLKDAHIASYERLDWSNEDKQNAIKEELNHRFWVDYEKLKKIALQLGFSECHKMPINKQIFQSTHMFDFYLIK
ncbi:class I SAM-dependent methyltransferase [Pseudoalteromonas denitrificans]|jgi:ubiquinone/menaquinone biosynthesis C-methylase UbiE|uniref:Ubiquinone/menaquinone biosynthesis C-methylase UbiE n=1 Tax=Pseudoalteromonas denitrificans DSM 6059 TaxID=1123010 RepID=A0A1I1HQA9_9GAMM|nr:class I SAM-dependent methyltransferase [Pseudoalteromonas denitrificans]SFC24138.1 Ubiquinone/menaquinone biosynthesis C-methylase UbiE [Pseudoalteromonas denitrificans DSM 6059]